MKQVFRKYLVPHEGNDHRPYLLRHRATAGIIVVALIAQVLFLTQYWGIPGASLLGDIATSALVAQSNAARAAADLPKLKISPLLEEAARRKAQDMALKGYFAHYGPDGTAPWSWISATGYAYQYAGENLAVNFMESSDVTDAWLASPAHRANILSAKYTEIGIATAPGVYKGQQVTFVVQMFGTPVVLEEAVPTPPTQVATAPVVPPAGEPAPAPTIVPEPAPAPRAITRILPRATVTAPAASTTAPVAGIATITTTTTPTTVAERVIPVAYAQEAEDPGQSPKTPLFALYAVMGALVALALAIKVIKVRIRHPQLILNGILVLIVLAGLVWYAEYVTLAKALIG